MSERFRTPFVPTQQYQRGSLGDLIARRGDIEAQGAMASGGAWANAISQVGNIAAGAFQEYGDDKRQREAMSAKMAADAPRIALETRSKEVDLQTKERALREAEKEAARAEELAVLFSGETMPTQGKLIKLMGPERGMALAKGLNALNPDKATQFKDQSALLRDTLFGVAAVPEAMRGPAYDMARKNLVGRGLITEDMAPAEYSPETFAQLMNFGNEPEADKAPQARVVGRSLVDDTGKVIYRDPESKSQGSDNKVWVMRPGEDGKMKTVFVAESQIREGDQPANTRSGEGRPSLGGEKSALGFFNRAKQADEELKTLTEQISGKGLGGQAWMALAPNFLQTQEGQAYQQAQRAFTEARLRKDSGAAIPETEFVNDRKTYFAQPGDSAETAAQKERGRAAVLASLAFQSGRALNEFYGDEAEPMLESFKGRQAGAKGASPKAVPPQTVKYQGKMVPFSSLPPELQAIVLANQGNK